MNKIFFSIVCLLISTFALAQNTRIPDFNNAKKILKKTDYLGVTKEIYCGCTIKPGNKFANDCGYKPKRVNARSARLESEHVVPLESVIGHTKAWDFGVPECKGKKGRACGSKVYGHIEGDLWNLLPAIGELNGLRSNYTVAEIPGEAREFGTCDFEIESRKMEPPEAMKPVMAAAYYYMQESYSKQVAVNLISNKNEKLLAAWYSKPMPAWACEWANRVKNIQGNDNKFMSQKCP